MAMDCVSPLLDVATRLWDCGSRRAVFICELEENRESLHNKMGELNSISQDVQTRIGLAEQHHKQPKQEVIDWLETVQDVNTKTNEILQKVEQVSQQRCLGSHCHKNCRETYKIGKKVVKMLNTVAEQVERGRNFDDVANDLPRPRVDEMPMEKTVGLDSMFENTWRCITDENIGIIGLWGLGGVGKTTLLKRINNEFGKPGYNMGIIDKVAWVVVSKDGTAENVQKDIGRKLGLSTDTWDSKNGDEKASDIYRILKDKRFVLLLDDIWKRIDVFLLGVPHPNKKNKSKIIFTTRLEEVCGHMEADKIIKLECLSPSQALELFREKVGVDTLNSHLQIAQLAESVAKECDGLPLALITIGRTMACKKTVKEWEYALRMLRECPSKISGMDEYVFSKLKFTYDSLCDKNIKSCFLYCCIFPEDYVIPIEKLVWLWIGEGLLNYSRNIDEAFNEGNEIIANLQHVCLLESDIDGNLVKMHDVIRDMALWIARKEKEYMCMIEGVAINDNQMVDWENAKRIAMRGVKSIDSNCLRTYANLSALLMYSNSSPIAFPRGFFQYMPVIKVLDFEGSGLEHVPAEIGILVSLQHLSFSETCIKTLPIELTNITNLRSLHLEHIEGPVSIPREVISALSKLQVLSLYRTVTNIVETNLFGHEKSLLGELDRLQYLDYVTLTITTVDDVKNLHNRHKLQCITRKVMFFLCEGLTSFSLSSFRSMSCLKEIAFCDCNSLEEIIFHQNEKKGNGLPPDNIPNFNFISYDQCFKILHQVKLFRCDRLKNMTWLIWAPNIKMLSIECCHSMEEVIGESEIGVVGLQNDLRTFSGLEILSLWGLPKLRSIYKHVLSFPCLKCMAVVDCPELKKLPFDSQSAKNSLRSIEVGKRWWDTLEWDDPTTRDAFFPYLFLH